MADFPYQTIKYYICNYIQIKETIIYTNQHEYNRKILKVCQF